jgi:hypothetical protein
MPAFHHEGETVDAEEMILAEVTAEIIVGNSVAAVTPTLLPGAALRFEVAGAMLLPTAPLVHLLRASLLIIALDLNMLPARGLLPVKWLLRMALILRTVWLPRFLGLWVRV